MCLMSMRFLSIYLCFFFSQLLSQDVRKKFTASMDMTLLRLPAADISQIVRFRLYRAPYISHAGRGSTTMHTRDKHFSHKVIF